MRSKGMIMAAVVAIMAAPPAWAGTITGTVKDSSGKALPGVMVRLTDPQSGNSEVVFSNAKGGFNLKTAFEGDLAVRLRAPYFRDLNEDVSLSKSAKLKKSYVIEAMTTNEEISDSLPALYHFGALPFEADEAGATFSRPQFMRDCVTCHQLGNSFTGYARPAEAWMTTLERMHGFMGNFDQSLRERRAAILAAGFNGQPISVRPVFTVDPEIFKAKIYQYNMSEGLLPHDAEVSEDDGLIYTIDQFADHMAVTDLKTGQTAYYPQPEEGFPMGGKFTQLGIKGALGGNTRLGPHSLALGHDGKWYTTNAIATTIGIFDPKTNSWEPSVKLPDNTLYPHTIRVAADGMIWFTLAFSEQVGRLDPKTQKVDVINLPVAKPLGMPAGTSPYGIDVNPKDGYVWYSRLFGDKIGKINPVTLEVTEYDSPVRGPRRMRFDAQGILWVAGFSDGTLGRIDPDGYKTKVYSLPEYAPGYHPAPYALGVNPKTQEIWVNGTMTDRMYRFLPKEERFIAYPMPLMGTYTRDASFTEDGKVCTSNNPIPVEALEGGVTEIICIDPDPS